MTSMKGRALRIPWFLLGLLLLVAVATAFHMDSVIKSRDITKSALLLFTDVDDVLDLSMKVVRYAVIVEWVLLALSAAGVIGMVLIVWGTAKRTAEMRVSTAPAAARPRGLASLFRTLVLVLAYVTVVVSAIAAAGEVAWLIVFVILKLLAEQGQTLLQTATDLALQWSTIAGSDFASKATTLLDAVAALNAQCTASGGCSDRTASALADLFSLSDQLQAGAENLSKIAGEDCPVTDTSSCIGLRVSVLSSADGCICEDRVALIVSTCKAGISETTRGLVIACVIFLLWLLYYGRVAMIWMAVHKSNEARPEQHAKVIVSSRPAAPAEAYAPTAHTSPGRAPTGHPYGADVTHSYALSGRSHETSGRYGTGGRYETGAPKVGAVSAHTSGHSEPSGPLPPA